MGRWIWPWPTKQSDMATGPLDRTSFDVIPVGGTVMVLDMLRRFGADRRGGPVAALERDRIICCAETVPAM